MQTRAQAPGAHGRNCGRAHRVGGELCVGTVTHNVLARAWVHRLFLPLVVLQELWSNFNSERCSWSKDRTIQNHLEPSRLQPLHPRLAFRILGTDCVPRDFLSRKFSLWGKTDREGPASHNPWGRLGRDTFPKAQRT